MLNSGKGIALILIIFGLLQSCESQTSKTTKSAYAMRDHLSPSRMTIAMWDYSWLFMHYPGGAFESYDVSTDELIERGFNTVRIDAFPLIIDMLQSNTQPVTISGDSLRNWGPTDQDRKHVVVSELLEFMRMTKEKGLFVIISSWGTDCQEFPDIREAFADPKDFWKAWEKVLDILQENDLLSHVVYVDFDQEFPFFSPMAPELNRLGEEQQDKEGALDAMEAAGRIEDDFKKLRWNPAQMKFVRAYMNSTLTHFQQKYPALRFTFSLTSFWDEVRAMNLKTFDVLELHFWLTQSERFISRSGFYNLQKDRGEHNYSAYQERIDKTMQAMRPMLIQDMRNRLAWSKAWSEEVGAPLVTTEAWGPWWHMDHPDLAWQWLYDWCEEGMHLSSEYELWGTTPWNYSHPYWDNWKNVAWYQKVNNEFKR